ncbi:MAG: DUF4139 domain-containing protein [Enhygromyxa sp.]
MSALVDLHSQVRAVTVYRRGAMVTRAAELVREGEGFPARLQLVGLPLSLDDSSVRVEVEAVQADAERALPIAGDLRVTLAVPQNDAQLAPPSDEELEQAKLELALIRGELEQLIQAEARLARLQPGARGRPEKGKPPALSPTAARLELLSFRRERAEQLAEKIQAQRERERLAKQRLASLQERERLASTQRNARTYELRKAAVLELNPDHSSGPNLVERVRIKLHYFVPGARWAPAYTLRLDRSMRRASLELRAMVGQASGEDWRDVALTLSTALPQQWTELPKLESQRIGRRQPPPAKTGWRPPPVGADQLYADFDRGLGEPLAGLDDDFGVDEGEQPEPADEGFSLAKHEEQVLREDAEEMARSRRPAPPPGPPPPPPSFAAPAPGAPPPMSRSMPTPDRAAMAPPETMMRPQAKRSGGLGAMLDGAVELMAATVAGGAAASYDEPSATFGMPPKPKPKPELLAGRELLDYGRLRLYPADDSRRGSLRRIDARVLYQQLSVESLEIELAISQIDAAMASARTLERAPAPEGHRWPSSEGGFDYAYVADGPCDLSSDGQFHSLPVDLREAEATPRYIAVPRETQDVFRIVALRNPLAAPLLPGPADVYVAGKFALSSALELTPIGGRIELGLGVEQAIKIARNVSFSEESSGMFKRNLGLRHTIEIEVANHLDEPATVELRERLPTPAEAQADDIKVEIEQVEPQWEDYEPKDPPLEGGRRWIVEVPGHQQRELVATWVITIPNNHQLIGGNRREA